ncbi:MAG TPA: hypothetical protein VGY97_02130 [Solirubrobacteraceae bacterium]|nr:hypothetical protein [Solirubrobacteraceae bacterium]
MVPENVPELQLRTALSGWLPFLIPTVPRPAGVAAVDREAVVDPSVRADALAAVDRGDRAEARFGRTRAA